MNVTTVLSTTREMLIVALKLATPFLLTAMLCGIVVGLLQAATRINDLTLSFVPRLVAVLLVIYLSWSWAFGQMIGYIERSSLAIATFRG